jgi:hypothetical protein
MSGIESCDDPIEMRLRIQRTAEPGIIMAIAWEGGFMTPGQGWITSFVQWVELRRDLLATANIPQKILDRAEKYFTAGRIFDIGMTARTSELQRMGFQKQTA